MTDPKQGTRLNEQQMETIRKEEVVDVYASLLDKIWQRALPILGIITVQAIFHRAIHVTARSHALLGSLTAGNDGLNTAEMRDRVGERDKQAIRQGFEELILNLFELLAELTGEAIVNKLFAEEIEAIRNDDMALMAFGFKWLRFAIYEEPSMQLQDKYADKQQQEKDFFARQGKDGTEPSRED